MEGRGGEWSNEEVQREVVRALARLRRLLTLENHLAGGQDMNNSARVRQIPPLLLLMSDHAKTVLADLNDYGRPPSPRKEEERCIVETATTVAKRKRIEGEEPSSCRPSASPSSSLVCPEEKKKPIRHSSAGLPSSLPPSYQEKVEASRRNLSENYKKAYDAKRRRTVKMLADIPLPPTVAAVIKNRKKCSMIPRR